MKGVSRYITDPSRTMRASDGLFVLHSDYLALEAQLSQANAELASARKDAERYRWLRSEPRYERGGPQIMIWTAEHGYQALYEDKADAALAREQEEKP